MGGDTKAREARSIRENGHHRSERNKFAKSFLRVELEKDIEAQKRVEKQQQQRRRERERDRPLSVRSARFRLENVRLFDTGQLKFCLRSVSQREGRVSR